MLALCRLGCKQQQPSDVKAILAWNFCRQPASRMDAQDGAALTSLECFVHIQLRAVQYRRSNRLQEVPQACGSLPDLRMLSLLRASLQQKQALLTPDCFAVLCCLDQYLSLLHPSRLTDGVARAHLLAGRDVPVGQRGLHLL